MSDESHLTPLRAETIAIQTDAACIQREAAEMERERARLALARERLLHRGCRCDACVPGAALATPEPRR